MRCRLFSIGKTSVYLQLGTLAYAAYMLLCGHGMLMLTSMLSIILHEAAHSAAAAALGHPPPAMEITPLGAVMKLEDESALPVWKRVCIVAAGPLASLLLAVMALRLSAAGAMSRPLGRMLFMGNLCILLFNLLPALPLDGGRLLAALITRFGHERSAVRTLRILTSAVGAACILLNLWLSLENGGWNLSLGMAGCFMLYAGASATTSAALDELRRLMDRKIRLEQRKVLPCCCLAVQPDTPLRLAITRMHGRKHTTLMILQPGSMKQLRMVGENELVAAYLECPAGNCELLCKEGEGV